MVVNLEARLLQLEREKHRLSGRTLTDAERAVRLVAVLAEGGPQAEILKSMLAGHRANMAIVKSHQ